MPSGTLSLPGRESAPAPAEGTDPRVQTIVAALKPETSRRGALRRADRGPGPGRVGRAPLVGSPPGLGRDLGLPQRQSLRPRGPPANGRQRQRPCGTRADDQPAMTAEATRPRGVSDQACRPRPPRWKERWGCLVPMVGLTVLSAGFAWWRFPRSGPVEPLCKPARPEARASRAEPRATRADSPPTKGKERILGAEGRRRLNEAIADLLERFDPTGSEASISGAIVDRPRPAIEDAAAHPVGDPTGRPAPLSRRYTLGRGPRSSASERRGLGSGCRQRRGAGSEMARAGGAVPSTTGPCRTTSARAALPGSLPPLPGLITSKTTRQ